MSDLTEFLSEAQDLSETFSRLLFEIEDQLRAGEDLDPGRINEAFRSIHTLKSLAGLANLKTLESFSHEVETSLDAFRLGKLELDRKALDLLFEVTNAVERLLEAGEDPSRVAEVDIARLLAALARLGPRDASGDDELGWLDSSIRGVLTEFEEHRLRENVRLGRVLCAVRVDFDLLEFGDRIDAIKARLKQHGEVITYLPSNDDSHPDRIVLSILLGSKVSPTEVAASVREDGGTVTLLRESQPEPASAASPEPVAEPVPEPDETRARASDEDDDGGASRTASQTVRVDLRRLDLLMNLVGELSLVHANLLAYADRVRPEQSAERSRELQIQLRTMSRRLGLLQGGILEVRMVPLQHTFERVKRLVHRTSRSLGREVQLVITGAHTELDKKIGEKLSKPLVHMVNNAIEHGIEPPDERERAGKPRVGRVELAAYQKGNRVVIDLRDDGKGIDWREIRDKALAKGFISAQEAADIDAARAINLIFAPGFSSKATASLTAGRGVGMDVVKTEIAELSGMIDIASEPGKGTRFRVTLPSTLAVIQALVIETAGQTFCIQLNSVLESLMVQARDIHTIEGHEVVSVRGRTLPLVYLARMFELQRDRDRAPKSSYDRLYVVVVGLAEHRVGLVVDELLGQQDVVIKPLGKALAQIPGIAGATELGDNRTVLLLDVATLVGETVGGVEAAGVGSSFATNDGIRVSTKLDM